MTYGFRRLEDGGHPDRLFEKQVSGVHLYELMDWLIQFAGEEENEEEEDRRRRGRRKRSKPSQGGEEDEESKKGAVLGRRLFLFVCLLGLTITKYTVNY